MRNSANATPNRGEVGGGQEWTRYRIVSSIPDEAYPPIMMRHREKLHGADEWDAFSRRSRRMLGWKRGELRRIKRGAAKRARKAAKAYIVRREGT